MDERLGIAQPPVCIEKVGAETTLDAAAVTVPFPALTLSAGTLSFVDGTTASVTVTNVLTLTGGTTLVLDASLDGDGAIDCLTVGGRAEGVGGAGWKLRL